MHFSTIPNTQKKMFFFSIKIEKANPHHRSLYRHIIIAIKTTPLETKIYNKTHTHTHQQKSKREKN